MNWTGGQVENIASGIGWVGPEAVGRHMQDPEIMAANDALKLLTKNLKLVIRREIKGKAFASDVDDIRALVKDFEPASRTTPRTALSSMKSVRDSLLSGWKRNNNVLADPTTQRPGIVEAEGLKDQLEDYIGQLSAAITLLERDLGVDPNAASGRKLRRSGTAGPL
jgi:hypothetical protein